MRITSVSYSRLVGLGNYENERVGATADVEQDEDWEHVLIALKGRVLEQVTNNESDRNLASRRDDLTYQIRDYEDRLAKAEKKWAAAEAFLKAHGIDPSPWADLPF